MSDQSRALPGQPNLRYLKVEAKRRLAAGEFATLHEAQLAIAREHGLPSWTALKERIGAEPSPVLTQVTWLVGRFAAANTPGWAAPSDEEMLEHFNEHFLTRILSDVVISSLVSVTDRLAGELVVTREAPQGIRAQVGGLVIEAMAEQDPPHRLTTLRMYPKGDQVTDPRVAAPATRTSGEVPGEAMTVAGDAMAEFGLPALALASAAPGGSGPVWVAARGWANLERPEQLRPGHLFPAYSVTKLITATAVLRLAADGRFGLDDPASEHLRTIQLANGAVTIRDLLSHTAGVDSPEGLFAATVPDLATLTGPVVACGGTRGTFAYSNGGYAVLGQLIADVTGTPYPDAAASLVLGPLGMTSSSFPASPPGDGAVTGYKLADDGTLEPVPPQLATMPAAGGLWAPAADLVRFAAGWASLLPAALAAEALRPHATRDAAGGEIGLGWLLQRAKDVCGHTGGGPAGAVSLIARLSDGQVCLSAASRLAPLDAVSVRLLSPI